MKSLFRGLLLLSIAPTLVFAQSSAGFDGLDTLLKKFTSGVITTTGYMLLTLATVAFFFGVVQFIWAARQGAEGKGISNGKNFMKWGLIALFVMFSVWGIIKFAQGVFQIQTDNVITVPSLCFGVSGTTNCPTQSAKPKTTATSPQTAPDYRNGSDVQSDTVGTAGGSGGGKTQTQANTNTNTNTGAGKTSTQSQTTYGGACTTSDNKAGYKVNGVCQPNTATGIPQTGCTYDDFGTELCSNGTACDPGSGALSDGVWANGKCKYKIAEVTTGNQLPVCGSGGDESQGCTSSNTSALADGSYITDGEPCYTDEGDGVWDSGFCRSVGYTDQAVVGDSSGTETTNSASCLADDGTSGSLDNYGNCVPEGYSPVGVDWTIGAGGGSGYDACDVELYGEETCGAI